MMSPLTIIAAPASERPILEAEAPGLAVAMARQERKPAESPTELSPCAAEEDGDSLARQLAQSQRELHIQRATAEQARRVAACLRTSRGTLLAHLAQPALTLDAAGEMDGFNPALQTWLALASAEAEPAPTLSTLFGPIARRKLRRAWLAFAIGDTSVSSSVEALPLVGPFGLCGGRRAARLTVVPTYRIAGVLEGAIVLIEPLA